MNYRVLIYSGCIVIVFCVVCILVINYTNEIKFKPEFLLLSSHMEITMLILINLESH